LDPLSTLTVRALPPAASLLLDGDPINNPSRRLKLTSGMHLLKATLVYRGQRVEEVKQINIKPKGKVTVVIDLTAQLKQ
jgi:hypothetical protein